MIYDRGSFYTSHERRSLTQNITEKFNLHQEVMDKSKIKETKGRFLQFILVSFCYFVSNFVLCTLFQYVNSFFSNKKTNVTNIRMRHLKINV